MVINVCSFIILSFCKCFILGNWKDSDVKMTIQNNSFATLSLEVHRLNTDNHQPRYHESHLWPVNYMTEHVHIVNIILISCLRAAATFIKLPLE